MTPLPAMRIGSIDLHFTHSLSKLFLGTVPCAFILSLFLCTHLRNYQAPSFPNSPVYVSNLLPSPHSMATATTTKQSPSTTASSSPVPGSPQSPINNNNNLNYQHRIGTTTLSSPGHITSYEYSNSKRIHHHQQQSSRHPSYGDGSQEEISSIAKQISDHAEAIYQTWKARGLAPTEILSCQLSTHASGSEVAGLDPVTSASGPFQSRLSPSYSHQIMPLSTKSSSAGGGGAAALNEFLAQPPDMSNNNKLEKLVNSFVNEDKARIAAQRHHQLSPSAKSSNSSGSGGVESSQKQGSPTKKISSSSSGLPSLSSVSVIKQTLQKFENQNNNNSPSAKNFNLIKAKPQQSPVAGKFPGSASPVNGSSRNDRNNNNNSSSPSQEEESLVQRHQLLKKNLQNSANNHSEFSSNKNVPDVLLNTLGNGGGGSSLVKTSAKPQTPVKPPNLLNHVPSWPLKNRAGSPIGNGTGSVVVVHEIHIEREGDDSPDAAVTIVPKLRSDSGGGGGSGAKLLPGGGGFLQNKMKSKTPPTIDSSEELKSSELVAGKRTAGGGGGLKKATNPQLLDAVKREEECLINALKNGGQVLKSSALVSDSMSKMSSSSSSEKRDVGESSLPVRNNINDNNNVSNISEPSAVGVTSNGSSQNIDNGSDATSDSGNSEDKENGSVTSEVNFELSSDVSGPPPSNLAHHVPKVWQNEDGVFESTKPTITSKMMKTRPIRSSVLEQMIKNEEHEAKLGKVKRDKDAGLAPSTPFLTRGSVAERVLIFERCPEIKAPPRMPSKLDPNKLMVSCKINSVSVDRRRLAHDLINGERGMWNVELATISATITVTD